MARYNLAAELHRANPHLKAIFDETRRRRIRLLILADGDIRFDESDLGLKEFITQGLLVSATPWEELDVVTAHRAADPTAIIQNFRFDTAPPNAPHNVDFTTEHYEQVWLFGRAEENQPPETKAPHPQRLTDSELAVLAQFMQDGGGVFATGDHQDLGAAMCGKVPRVRSMRRWFYYDVPESHRAPGRNDGTRLDTLREGFDAGYTPDDQSDRVPQEIRPRFRMAEGRRDQLEPHPLLARGTGAITVLPDHMHVGECVIPTCSELEATFSFGGTRPAEEFPALMEGKRLAPEVVAIATSPGGHLQGLPGFPPVEPRCFNAIVAYEGSRVGVGRVVVDASFHHFAHVNLRGSLIFSHPKNKKGFYDENNNPTPEYEAIKQYYRNLAMWLCPEKVRVECYAGLLAGLRHLSPLDEEIQPEPEPTLDDILYAGAVTQSAITNIFSRVEATQCALALSTLLPDGLRVATEQLTDPWLPKALRDAETRVLFFAGEQLLKVILGGAMLGVAAALAELPADARADDKSKGDVFVEAAAAGLAKGFGVTAKAMDSFAKNIEQFSATLQAFR